MAEATEAPVAPTTENQEPAAAASATPAGDEGGAAAAAESQKPQVDPEVKKLRDRLAEEGRRRAEATKLALDQANQIAQLSAQVATINQHLTQQQQDQFKARLAAMTPEEQIATLTEHVLNPRPAPQPQSAPQPQQVDPAQAQMQAIMESHLAEINASLGLDEEPLTPEDIGRHANEGAWVAAAWKLGNDRVKGKSEVPGKKQETPAQPNIEEMVNREVERRLGVGRPNSATPAGSARSVATIEELNRIAADRSLGPLAKAEALRKLQAAS